MKMEGWKLLIDFNFYQNYRQRYTVIPITTVRGPLEGAQCLGLGKVLVLFLI